MFKLRCVGARRVWRWLGAGCCIGGPRLVAGSGFSLAAGARTPQTFPTDAYRRGDEFVVFFDLPGTFNGGAKRSGSILGDSVTRREGSDRTVDHEGDAELIAAPPTPLKAERPQDPGEQGRVAV